MDDETAGYLREPARVEQPLMRIDPSQRRRNPEARVVEGAGAWVSLLVLVLCLLSGAASAVIETYEFSNTSLEARYHRLSQELRCPKCQNQNIADSNAPIAQDLRKLLFTQLESGKTDTEILADMVARYGEFVRYRPDASGATLWLWLAPAIMLVFGFGLLVLLLRRGTAPAAMRVSEADERQLNVLLGETPSVRPNERADPGDAIGKSQ